jgi:predicted regulator of Ras-like GTPase activity (Roadblock/LC7/MglB family)
MVKKKRSPQEIEATTEPIAIEETAATSNLRADLEEIKNCEGVIGYIFRNTTSASIDLKDPTKLIDYALLSSSALDAAEELSKLFNLGETKNVLVEGKNAKMLSLTAGENKISVFMEKNAESDKILRKISTS